MSRPIFFISRLISFSTTNSICSESALVAQNDQHVKKKQKIENDINKEICETTSRPIQQVLNHGASPLKAPSSNRHRYLSV